MIQDAGARPGGGAAALCTYSNVTALPSVDREQLLDGLAEVAQRQFGGCVERNLSTAIYTARR
ncbi:hypothetical protein PRN20_11930 [Devosia sp. ZB163]|uniref:hypothetical protein n=1 Tax=Devosia sp. ZB163 TaxID=3025938 RepID=UPI002360355F|nr:hypothetical protein [Devosia sp. ZB163]MDC9824443.1 hypothetical protein [Devosia sp. ZB163]